MSKIRAKVYFFPNGNTAVFVKDKQYPKCQRSWFKMFVDFLDISGVDVIKSEYMLPNGDSAELVKTETGYNWKIQSKERKYNP